LQPATPSISFKAWKSYENELWFRKLSYDPEFESNETFKSLIEEAITYARLALDHLDNVHSAGDRESSSLRFEIANSLAYYLATRRSDGDETQAEQLLQEVDRLMPAETLSQLGVNIR